MLPMQDYTPPTISSLPNELINPILLSVSQSDLFPIEVRQKHGALLRLGLVCHRWHDVICSERRLWTECSAVFVGNEKTPEEADHATMDALEVFYAKSGSTLGLSFECRRGRAVTQQVVSRLQTLLIESMAYRWTKMEFTSSQQEMSLADPGASWIYHLMDLAIKEKDLSGYSPFSNVEFLRMDFPWMVRSRFSDLSAWTDITALPLCHLFPNLISLTLVGGIENAERLYRNFAFKQLTALRFAGLSKLVALQDLLSQLPMLKHLDASGVVPDPFRALFTHGALEVFKIGDVRFHDRCSTLSFPSLQRLSLRHPGDYAFPSRFSLTALSTMLTTTPTRLRVLELDKKPLNEMDLYRLLRRLPTLETLVLQVPFNNEWAAMKGTVFRSLREHSSDSLEMPLPRLREIMMHMYGKVASEREDDDYDDPAYRRAEFAGFCALRDAFIDFVEDPRRGLTDNETDDISEADNLSAPIEEGGESSSLTPEVARAARLEIARFDYEDEDRGRSGVIYHAGKDYARGCFRDEHFIWG
ncbi:hypothetical protein BKA70DRAFT_578881 [Coprinopsis sp. MPI-PUGE-AT-0042]|nr:hypothetical protein BKA70DRAFT_578881 [Coprinopsis sp. MPI-PUGE-AT-0042]